MLDGDQVANPGQQTDQNCPQHHTTLACQIADNAGGDGTVVVCKLLEPTERSFDGRSSIRPRSNLFSPPESEHFYMKTQTP
ncbi:hypothetical protein [Methylocystis sp.]|uniref:hypothetical protein n=1 Tax=Methylocystis sp. TaxID=1911079 RepID=UPI002735FDBA|nr:hypothetical protein [Methylocystis sp.]